ncbi:MAG: Lrp/AsnC family transcriptional regulator [Candidatus Aenigmarchaeota archaeon]|nr:Lrp/AsnC family transcriptional regulator [Candidatus Aenigmarchaeota archaeon]
MLEKKDLQIINLLEKGGKLSTKKISRRLGIPQTTVHNRIKKLEKEGIIEGYKVVINKKKIGKGIGAYALVTINYPSSPDPTFQESVAKQISLLPEIEEVSIVTGETDVLIKFYVSDTDQLNDFVVKKLRTIKGIDKTRTSIIMKQMK